MLGLPDVIILDIHVDKRFNSPVCEITGLRAPVILKVLTTFNRTPLANCKVAESCIERVLRHPWELLANCTLAVFLINKSNICTLCLNKIVDEPLGLIELI